MQQRIEKRAVTPREAAEMYGLSEGTLANYRSRGVGPKYYRVPPGGRKVIYFVTDIESWLMRNPVLTYDTHEQEHNFNNDKRSDIGLEVEVFDPSTVQFRRGFATGEDVSLKGYEDRVRDMNRLQAEIDELDLAIGKLREHELETI